MRGMIFQSTASARSSEGKKCLIYYLTYAGISRGATKKKSKRVGRGPGSGHGKTSTRGHKGKKPVPSGVVKRGYEGGQMPLHRRLPKFGFTKHFQR